MMKTLTFLFLTLLALAPLSLQAQGNEADGAIGHASLVSEYDAISRDGDSEGFWLALEIRMPDDWHLYWRNPGDSGIPPSVKLTLPQGFKQGPLHWPVPEIIPYDFLTNFGYSDPAYVMIPIIPPASSNEKEYRFSGKAEWLICKEVCIPESADISLTLPVNDTPELVEGSEIHEAITLLPKPFDGTVSFALSGDYYESRFFLEGDSFNEEDIKSVMLFAHESGVFSHTRAEQSFEVRDGALHVSVAKGGIELPSELTGTLLVENDSGESEYYSIRLLEEAKVAPTTLGETEVQGDSQPAQRSVEAVVSIGALTAILFAFLGGVILNLMPCVLPVLSLKALSLAKLQDKEKSAIRVQAIAYTAGILVTFVSFALMLIALKSAGQSVGWGFQLQEPIFVAALLYIVFAVGLNLSGVFEIRSVFGNVGGGLTQGNSPKASFFTGMLATLVATPCTAPFMAGALGYAVTQPAPVMLLIFISLGLGLAAPYLLVSFVPLFRHLLPKPGAWMEGFKQFLAFPMYATAAWLLWVLTVQAGNMGMLWALGGLIAIAYFGWAMRRGYGRVTKILTVIFVLGMVGHSLKAQESMPSRMAKYETENAVTHVAFSEEKLAALRANGTPVFVDATAAWCITCKVNERTSINIESTQAAFAEMGVTMMIADWTNRNEPIRQYLERFGRNGVPLYVYYAPGEEGRLLPQILTPEIVLDAIGAK